MMRRLRVLAAFFMVPLVILSNPQSAAAAGGSWQQVHLAMDVLGSNDWVGRECTFNVRNTGTTIDVGSGGWCAGLPDASAGGLQPGEAGSSFTFTFDGLNASGASCGATYGGTLGQHSSNGTMRVAGSIPAHSSTITGGEVGDQTCQITEVCVRLMDSEFACQGVVLEPGYEEPPNPCPAGVPHVSGKWVQGDEAYEWEYELTFTRTGAPLSTARWFFSNLRTNGEVGTGEFTTTNKHRVYRIYTAGAPTFIQFHGVEMWATAPPGGLNTQASIADTHSRSWSVSQTRPTVYTQSFAGWTQPGECRFWVGNKIVNDDTTDQDEPFAPMVEEPYVPPTEEPEPEVTQPVATDEPDDDLGWLGMIWAVLQSIWGTIKSVLSAIRGLVSGIVTGIVDGVSAMMRGLFVPDDGYLEGKWGGVENKWAATTPAKYVDAVQGFNPGAVSGCGGLPLNVTLPGGVAIEQNIGAACGGAMASAAGVVRAALTAVMVVGGAFACVRAVGSGLGWNPGVGRGADA